MVVIHSSYACEPLKGSEPEVGWRWMLEMSKFHHVIVFTRSNNQPVIEGYLAKNPSLCQNVTFLYFDLGPLCLAVKRRCNWLNWYYVLWQWKARKHIQSAVDRHKADLVHLITFASFRYPVFLGGLTVPVVWGPVGGAETASWCLLFHNTRLRSCIKEVLRNVATRFSGAWVNWVNPCRRAGGCVIASTPRTQQVLSYKGIDCKVLPTIGLNEHYHSEGGAFPLISDGLRFLFVGRLVVLKGVHLLLEAFAQAAIPQARLTIVGDGPELSHLIKLADQLEIGQLVDFIGHVPKEDINEVYQSHHVLVAPSLYESGGYMVLEAFVNERPAIVLDVGGLALSVDESCGIKVPLGSCVFVVEGLSRALMFYDQHPDKILMHGKAGRVKCDSEYGWPSKGREMSGIYELSVKS